MTRTEVLEALVAVRNGALAISGPGSISRLLWTLRHEPGTIYQMDMGYAAAMCVGLALARPDQRVLAVEGDGSMIAGLSTLTTIGRYRPANLVLVVIDNGAFASAGDGSHETGTRHGTDLAAVARACGIPAEKVFAASAIDAVRGALKQCFAGPGPWVLVAKVDDSDLQVMRGKRGAIPYDIVETVVNFRRELERRDK
jgi:sulfopyruvate decarboxylase subunit beta